MNKYDERVAEAVQEISKEIPMLHSLVYGYLSKKDISMTDALVDANVDDEGHMFHFLFQRIEQMDGSSYMTEVAEKFETTVEKLGRKWGIIPNEEDDIYGLTAAWVRHFSRVENIIQQLNDADDEVADRIDNYEGENFDENRNEVLDDILGRVLGKEELHAPDPVKIAKELVKHPGLLTAVHQLMHTADWERYFHLMVKVAENEFINGTHSIIFHQAEAFEKFYSPKREVLDMYEEVKSRLSFMEFLNMMRNASGQSDGSEEGGLF